MQKMEPMMTVAAADRATGGNVVATFSRDWLRRWAIAGSRRNSVGEVLSGLLGTSHQ